MPISVLSIDPTLHSAGKVSKRREAQDSHQRAGLLDQAEAGGDPDAPGEGDGCSTRLILP
jgi:hypothetical protein